jgi:SnoaL-like domain
MEALMPEQHDLAAHYIALWNETDAKRRRALLAESWTEDASYADPLIQRSGYAEIDELIGAVQARFPGFRFALDGRVDGHGDHLRISWTLGPEDGDPVVRGTDFARAEGGRFKAVTGFLDHVPDAA